MSFFKKTEFGPEFQVKVSKNSHFWPFLGDFTQPKSCGGSLTGLQRKIKISLNLQVKIESKKKYFRLFSKFVSGVSGQNAVFSIKNVFRLFRHEFQAILAEKAFFVRNIAKNFFIFPFYLKLRAKIKKKKRRFINPQKMTKTPPKWV